MPSNEFARHNKEILRSGLLLPVEYLRNGKRYSRFVFTVAKCKSHTTKRCNPRLCCCYRFWDIVVANIKNFKIFHFDENLLEQIRICRRTSSHGIIKKILRSGLLLPVEYLRNGKRYSRFVFTVAKCKSHATKRCNPRFCCCYRFWDIVVANIKNFKIFHFDENSLEQIRICRRTSSHGIIKKYRVQGFCFRSNISKTVKDIRVSFSLWPSARDTLPNGATHVSVVVIVSEIL